MCMSGVGVGGERDRQVRVPFVVEAGTTMRGARVFPTATGTTPPAATATWVLD